MILTKTKTFIRDSHKLKMSDKHFTKFVEVLYFLSKGEPLPPEFKDHALLGNYSDARECHISGDLLLIYQSEGKTVKLVRLGSHSQVFK